MKENNAKHWTKIKNQVDITIEEINKYDPIGLIKSGAPKDEYQPEAVAYVLELSSTPKKDDFKNGELLRSIFVRFFWEDMVPSFGVNWTDVARKIRERIENNDADHCR